MAAVNLKALVAKLNPTCRQALEAAAGLCLSRTNYNVEIEHWLLKILEVPNTDFDAILRQFEIDVSRLQRDLTRVLDRLQTGNSRPPALSPNVVDLAREAWVIASIDYGATTTRSGHVVLALLTDDALARVAHEASPEFRKIHPEALRQQLASITSKSAEAETAAAARPSEPGAAVRQSGPTKTPALDQYTINLTARAKSGKIDPVLGRDPEIRQIIDILTRRRQNNPILTGEAGVGKTAVVEGFALRIAAGDVPEPLKNVALHTLDLGLLQAGAGVKGEFENRLKSVIEEVKSSPTPIIMFIDEAHTLIGAGGQAGQGDAANLLKPALARGELRTIAATTWAEYKKYFERDAALARRFQVVKVEEPDEAVAIDMMRGLVSTLESHHNVLIMNDGVVDAVKLSHRYISGRQLPDKAVSLLDTTCARIAISQSSTPPPVEDCTRRITQLGVAIDILQREMEAGADHAEEIARLTERKAAAEEELLRLKQRWQTEKELVTQITTLRAKLASLPTRKPGDKQTPAPPLSPEERQRARKELEEAEIKLRQSQGELPLVHACVDSTSVAETVSAWTGIPLGRMVANELNTVLNLKSLMEECIIGQSHALEAISQRIRTSRAGLSDPRQPIGVFLLAGTSGVGKTETAITLANLLYGGEQNMTVINMSEFKEEHKVSLLMGSPPGYVGYGEGGVLTEAVRRKPYSVVLLDEMEKAHPGVQDIFYQVFDKGTMKDGEGRDINFKNTVIMMTTNAGTDFIKSLCADPDTRPDPEAFAQAVFPELLKTFKPAFLGRLSIVPFYPLSDDVMKRIIKLKLGKVGQRVRDHYKARFQYSPALVDAIAKRCTEVDTGARNVDHILTRTLLPELSSEFLARMAAGGAISAVHIDVNGDGSFKYELA
jgi:type VI secretion system protein VasG